MIETSNEVPPMSVVMTFFSPIAAPRNIDAVTPDTGPESSVRDRKSTRLNSSHSQISYAVFCLKKNSRLGLYPELVQWILTSMKPAYGMALVIHGRLSTCIAPCVILSLSCVSSAALDDAVCSCA